MPVTFQFELDVPTGNQDPQDMIKCYESDDGATGWDIIEEVDVSALPVADGIVTYACAVADSSKYHILSPVSATLVEYPLSVQKIIPPAATDATLFTAYINVSEIDGDRMAGAKLSVEPKVGEVAVTPGGKIVVGAEEVITDESGFASLAIVADIGLVKIKIDGRETEVNTEGRGGTAVDLSSFFGG